MADVEYSTTAELPIDLIWRFVEDMDNWATFVVGYQGHEKQSETDSVWTLKGDVGAVARTVKFQVHIEEWAGPERVRFTLTGLNESMDGGGTFLLEPFEEGGAAADLPTVAPAKKEGLFARLLAALARFFFRRTHGEAERATSADSGPGAGVTKLTFQLSLTPGGPMGPMINALVKPLLMPAAEDLANQIMAHLEKQHASQ